MSQEILNKMAEALGVDADDLAKSQLGKMLNDISPVKKELSTDDKIEALSKEIAELKAAVAGDDDDDKDMTDDEKAKAKAKADDDDMRGKKKPFPGAAPPFKSKKVDDDDDDDKDMTDDEKAKAKKDADDAAAAEKVDAEKSDDGELPWPKDLATKDFREGKIEKRDAARDWGLDPWAKKTG